MLLRKRSQTPLLNAKKGKGKNSYVKLGKAKENAKSSKALLDWATEYFENHKEILKLMGVNSADELLSRVLDLVNKYSGR
jgi:hypothetical protein